MESISEPQLTAWAQVYGIIGRAVTYLLWMRAECPERSWYSPPEIVCGAVRLHSNGEVVVRRRFSMIILILWTLSVALLSPFDSGRNVANAAGVGVNIVNFAFQAPSITVRVGDTVTWTNVSPTFHTTTSTTSVWNSGTLSPGQTFAFTFNTVGTYTYFCAIHTSMQGTVNVTNVLVPDVQVSVVKDATNQLRVILTARSGQTLSRLDWALPVNASAEALDGTRLPTGVSLPAGTATTSFHLKRLSGQSVFLPIVVTGSFGTWRTFVGGGPGAW